MHKGRHCLTDPLRGKNAMGNALPALRKQKIRFPPYEGSQGQPEGRSINVPGSVLSFPS